MPETIGDAVTGGSRCAVCGLLRSFDQLVRVTSCHYMPLERASEETISDAHGGLAYRRDRGADHHYVCRPTLLMSTRDARGYLIGEGYCFRRGTSSAAVHAIVPAAPQTAPRPAPRTEKRERRRRYVGTLLGVTA